MYLVYLITRLDDNKQYVGECLERRLKQRMHSHSYDRNRFYKRPFKYEILESNLLSKKEALKRETFFVEFYDTFRNGLNSTKDGSGNNYTDKFTTLGFKFGIESRKLMSKRSKDRGAGRKLEEWRKDPKNRTAVLKAISKMSTSKKNKAVPAKCSLTETQIIDVLELFKSRPELEGVGEISRNGKRLTYKRAFSTEFANKFGMTDVGLYNGLIGKTLSWVPLLERIIGSKS